MNAETAMAYCAGLFDGEGCITICRQADQLTMPTGGFHLQLRMAMTSEHTVRRFHELVQCGTVRGQASRDASRLATWVWGVFRGAAQDRLLEAWEPYLVAKAREAALARRLLRTNSIAERKRLWLAARSLKTRGRGHWGRLVA